MGRCGIHGSSRILFLICLTICMCVFISCRPSDGNELSGTEFVLNTVCSIRIYRGGDASLIRSAFNRLRGIEAELGTYGQNGEIERVNAHAGVAPVRVGDDALAVVSRGLEYAKLSDGAFDPSVGPLVRLWGIGTDHAQVPQPSNILEALKCVGWKDVVLDQKDKTIFLRRKGMLLDLGSVTKGYAADAVADILKTGGVTSAIIDLGGNIVVIGSRPDGSPWRIGLQDPADGRGSSIGIASLVDESMVTSGVYERFLEKDGKRYHHILDTSTGYPVDNGLVSATVIAPKSFDADGLTTTIFALGRTRGMELAVQRGVGAILVDADNKVYMTPGLSRKFRLTNSSYTYAE